MIVPYEEALQELWVSHRVDQYQREHRPAPDLSLFVAEFKTAIERIKDEARREALRSAASEVRREARWQEEQLALHESRSSIVRLLMLEQIFIDWSNQEEA